ncbi:hypothetical protein [Aquimarina sp. 2304DJ70-9]|uniref:hypothetical protein n=1 Tax=Aquimarina penaris TaxID=3231044 RepID=UPI00346371FF
MCSQEFEGIVTYEVKLQIVGQESDSSLLEAMKMFKSTQIDYYKESQYKSISSDPFQDTETVSQFDTRTKLTYAYVKDNHQQAFWYDASKHVSKDFSVTEVEDDYILGHKCKGLKFKSEKIEITYWFTDSYKIDINRYKNNYSYYFSEFIKRTGRLPLKYSINTGAGQYNIITAINIQEKSLKEMDFEIPKFDRLIESTN